MPGRHASHAFLGLTDQVEGPQSPHVDIGYGGRLPLLAKILRSLAFWGFRCRNFHLKRSVNYWRTGAPVTTRPSKVRFQSSTTSSAALRIIICGTNVIRRNQAHYALPLWSLLHNIWPEPICFAACESPIKSKRPHPPQEKYKPLVTEICGRNCGTSGLAVDDFVAAGAHDFNRIR
jgi:hypothetical protein